MFRYLVLLFFIPLYIFCESKILVFAPLPMEDVKTTYLQFSPLAKYLEKQLDLKIKIDYNTSYDEVLKKFVEEKIDIAYLGPLPFLSLEKIYPDLVPLVNFKNQNGDISYTCSFVSFITNFKPIKDLTNTKIALTQPLSTCGYLFVNNILENKDSNIEKNKYKYLGRHDKVALSVIRNEFEYGGLKTNIAKEYSHLGLKELVHSKPIPNFILVANAKSLNIKLIKKIKDTLLLLNNQDLSKWHESLKFGVKETNLEDYNHLRELIESTKIPHQGNF